MSKMFHYVPCFLLGLFVTGGSGITHAQIQPINERPNPYTTTDGWAKLPQNREWGSTAGVDIDPDGVHLWAIDRCGGNSCAGSNTHPIVKIDASGNVVAAIGGGLMLFPHGLHVDAAGDIWVTDAGAPDLADAGTHGKGHTVYKLSPDGEVLMILGSPGIAGNGSDALLNTPCDVVTDADGYIYIGDGHDGQGADANEDTVARIVKFDGNGGYITSWGGWGSGQGKLKTPHALDIDSQNRLVVGDRGNNRLQIFDLEGNYISEFNTFSRPSGIFITADDTIYVADSESEFDDTRNPGWHAGIRVGSLQDGSVDFFIDGAVPAYPEGSNPEGVAVDSAGNVFGAVVSGGGALLKSSRSR